MKKIIYVLVFCLLLSSCHFYGKEIKQTYTIETSTTNEISYPKLISKKIDFSTVNETLKNDVTSKNNKNLTHEVTLKSPSVISIVFKENDKIDFSFNFDLVDNKYLYASDFVDINKDFRDTMKSLNYDNLTPDQQEHYDKISTKTLNERFANSTCYLDSENFYFYFLLNKQTDEYILLTAKIFDLIDVMKIQQGYIMGS